MPRNECSCFRDSGEALSIVFVRIFTLHERHYHRSQVRKCRIFSPFLRSSLEVSLIICQNKSPHEKIAWRYPETQKDKCYIHRGGVGNAQGTPQVQRFLIWIVLKSSFTSQGKAKALSRSWVFGKTLRTVLEATKLYLKKLSHSHFAYLLLRPDH